MLLPSKNAVVYGAGGSMGGAIARAFAREGATVFLAGRTVASLEAVAEEIVARGGTAHAGQVDALDEAAVEAHLAQVADQVGHLDISLNAVGMEAAVQGVPLVDLPLEDFLAPVTHTARTQFLTARAAARRMTVQGSGVILMLSSSAARESGPQMGGFSVACAAIECFGRTLAGEVGRDGVRVVTLRPNFTPETAPEVPVDELLADLQPLIDGTALGRLPRLAEVADTAAFAASDGAGAMTGAVLNLTCGAITD